MPALLISAFALTTAAQAAVKVSPVLADKVAEAAPGTLVPVYVVMEERLDRNALEAAYPARLYTKMERRDVFRSQAKALANRTQRDLVQFLRDKEAQGEVDRLRPLWIVNVVAFDATPAVLEEVFQMPGIERAMFNEKVQALPVEPVAPADPADPQGNVAGGNPVWSLNTIRAPEVWSTYGITGTGVVVGHFDTGACYNHTDLAANTWINTAEIQANGIDDDGNGYVDDYRGWDFDPYDSNPDDDNGHGTHTMGTVVGDGTAGTQTGVAPGAKVMICKVLEFGFNEGPAVWEAQQYSLDNGADLTTASIGWVTGSHEKDRGIWREASDAAIYAGTMQVFAAGNERGWGSAPDLVRTPGDVPDVITVAATTQSDNIASFSSPGPVEWGLEHQPNNPSGQPIDDEPYRDWEWISTGGLVKPDVAAPGDLTNSTVDCSGYSGNTWSGTSMATPHIAGVIALMLEANPLLTRDDVMDIFADTSIDLGPAGKDNDYGVGRVDAFEAVTAALTPADVEVSVISLRPIVPLGTPIMAQLNLTNTTSSDITFDLWVDVTEPDGTVYASDWIGPRSITLTAGQTFTKLRGKPSNGFLPGTYRFTLKVGEFGVSVWDAASFQFTIPN